MTLDIPWTDLVTAPRSSDDGSKHWTKSKTCAGYIATHNETLQNSAGLPDEVWMNVFLYLQDGDLLCCALASKSLSTLALGVLWRKPNLLYPSVLRVFAPRVGSRKTRRKLKALDPSDRLRLLLSTSRGEKSRIFSAFSLRDLTIDKTTLTRPGKIKLDWTAGTGARTRPTHNHSHPSQQIMLRFLGQDLPSGQQSPPSDSCGEKYDTSSYVCAAPHSNEHPWSQSPFSSAKIPPILNIIRLQIAPVLGSRIKTLRLVRMGALTDDIAQAILCHLPNLCVLDVSGNHKLTDTIVPCITACVALTDLGIWGTPITHSGIATILDTNTLMRRLDVKREAILAINGGKTYANLEWLSIRSTYWVPSQVLSTNSRDATRASAVFTHLSCSSLTDQNVLEILTRQCCHLNVLRLRNCFQLTAQSAIYALRAPKVHTLDFIGVGRDFKLYSLLENCHNIAASPQHRAVTMRFSNAKYPAVFAQNLFDTAARLEKINLSRHRS